MACSTAIRLPILLWRNILCSKACQLQSQRTTIILRRKHPVPLVPVEKPVSARKMKGKHFIYEPVRDTIKTATPDIQCILTRHVDGLGVRGDTVTLKRCTFRRQLLASGYAVYASPENIQEYGSESQQSETKKSLYALQTFRLLSGMNLPIRMNAFTQWTLTKSHIKVAFRLSGIHINDENCITLPEEPITRDQDESVPFQVKVKINGLDEATVDCYKTPITTDPNRKSELAEGPKPAEFRKWKEVEKELIEQGIFHRTD